MAWTLEYNLDLDKAGNRTSVTDNVNGNATYTPNTLNQYSAVSGTTITNNGNHQIGSYRNVTYTYMNDGQLVQAQGGSNTYQFLYDALGRCVKRSINGTIKYYIYDGDKPILEYDAAGALAARNVYGKGVDELLMRTDYTFNPTAVFYYQHDHAGSATHLTNGSGDVIERYRYDVFGAPTIYPPQPGATPIPASAVSNRFLFTGREYAAAFGFYEYRARAYHPGLGRFTSEDPKLFDAGDYNLYRYCHNAPLDMTDPMGMGVDFQIPPSPPTWQPPPQNAFTRPSGTGYSIDKWGRTGFLGALPVSNTLGVLGANQNRERPLVRGNQALVQLVNRLGGTTVYRWALHRTILQLMGMGYSGGTLIGYSRGGVVMVHEMANFPSFHFHAIGIDPARFGTGALRLSANVTSAKNYYQQNQAYNFGENGNSFKGTPMTSDYINVQNYNFTGDPRYTHETIVGLVSDRIVNGE